MAQALSQLNSTNIYIFKSIHADQVARSFITIINSILLDFSLG